MKNICIRKAKFLKYFCFLMRGRFLIVQTTDTSLVSHMADGPLIFILQFAADVKAEIVGKPSETFFSSVLEDMGVSPENVRQT